MIIYFNNAVHFSLASFSAALAVDQFSQCNFSDVQKTELILPGFDESILTRFYPEADLLSPMPLGERGSIPKGDSKPVKDFRSCLHFALVTMAASLILAKMFDRVDNAAGASHYSSLGAIDAIFWVGCYGIKKHEDSIQSLINQIASYIDADGANLNNCYKIDFLENLVNNAIGEP